MSSEMKIRMNILCLLIVIFTKIHYSEGQTWSYDGGGVFEKFRNGLKMAGNFFGMDAASNVAQLINEAFKKSVPKSKPTTEENGGFVASVLKMLSFDKSKISAIVINALIFLAQMISTSLTRKPALPLASERYRKLTDGSPLEWILENKSNSFKSLLKIAEDNDLTEKVIDSMGNQEKTPCVRQLICRISPFVRGMQKALKESRKDSVYRKEDSDRNGAFFRYLPDVEEFKKHGEECKHLHEECRLLD